MRPNVVELYFRDDVLSIPTPTEKIHGIIQLPVGITEEEFYDLEDRIQKLLKLYKKTIVVENETTQS